MRRADPAAGLDAEQARVAETGVKAMISVGRPFLDYVISALADAGITDVCLVIGPEHDRIRDHYSSGVPLERVRVHFAVQPVPRGTADAVSAARHFSGRESFLVLNGDNYYPTDAYRLLARGEGAAVIGFDPGALIAESNIPPDRLRAFALITADARGCLDAIIEKPDPATYADRIGHSLVGMNLWAFTPLIFEACARVTPSERGELEIQDAVRIAVRELGECIRVIPYSGGVLDLSTRRDIEPVAERLRGVEVRL